MKIFSLIVTGLAALTSAEATLLKGPGISADAGPQAPSKSTWSSKPPAASPTIYRHFDCGTGKDNGTLHFLQTVKNLHQQEKTLGAKGVAALAARAATVPLRINLYMHIITTAANRGTVTPAMVAAQVAALNAAYNPYGVVFLLQAADYTVNDAWAAAATPVDESAFKQALRRGSYADLNLYFLSDMAGGVLGKCTLPTQIGADTPPATYAVDGCALAAQTMPGGRIYGYSLGKTAVHETGHWLGLLHTFEGYSCSGPGDYVSDTPAESQSTDGCPLVPRKNSCAGSRPGVDPIRNYMDYSTDACYVRFTAGQVARVRSLWALYRRGK